MIYQILYIIRSCFNSLIYLPKFAVFSFVRVLNAYENRLILLHKLNTPTLFSLLSLIDIMINSVQINSADRAKSSPKWVLLKKSCLLSSCNLLGSCHLLGPTSSCPLEQEIVVHD